MTVTIDATGLHIQTYEEVLEEVLAAYKTGLELTDVQIDRIRRNVKSTLGQIARIEAEREVLLQEALVAVYNTLSFYADGAALERVVRLLGVTKLAAANSRVSGTVSGDATTVIPINTRLRYAPEGTIWKTAAEYVIGGGGTVTMDVIAEDTGALTVALDPVTGFDDWEILDTVTGFNAFESTTLEVLGRAVETSAALRARTQIEAFRRAQGPLKAIEAAVSAVDGVTYVRAYDNRTLVTDANGLPGKSINVVVEGGDDQEVAEAIFKARPAGAELFGLSGGSLVTATVTDDYNFEHTVNYNRVSSVTMWIRGVATTSTSEEAAPANVTDLLEAQLLLVAQELFGIGDDVIPYKLERAGNDIPGLDDFTIELSLNGSSWSTAKRVITIRQKAAFDAARISVTEA